MIRQFLKWLNKGGDDANIRLPENEHAKFVITAEGIALGELECYKGEWTFKYTDEFKKRQQDYNLIVGFPDVNKVYRSESLWPFFRIRIPGLKQPSVQTILKNENIDQANEVELLKRFGHKTIANPYEMEFAG